MKISLAEPTHIFEPYASVRGSITGTLYDPVEVQLIWQTKGSGARIRQVVDQQTCGQETGNHFSFTLPHGPYSFNGSLLALHWSIELVKKRKCLDSIELVVSPIGEMYDLKRIVIADSTDPSENESNKALFRLQPKLKKQMEDYRAMDHE